MNAHIKLIATGITGAFVAIAIAYAVVQFISAHQDAQRQQIEIIFKDAQ